MSNYSTLLNKYNRLAGQNNDLLQQLADRIEQSRARESRAKHVESLARSLCKLILAKNPQEMVLGKSYSWDTVSIEELLNKASQTFKVYNASQTELLKRLIDENEDRRETIETLTSALQDATDNSTGEIKGGVEEAVAKAEKKKADEVATKKVAYAQQKAAQEGKIELIIGEDSDTSEQDIADYSESVAMSSILHTNKKSIPVHPAQKKIREKEKRLQEEEKALSADLKEIGNRMGTLSWHALMSVGRYGVSEYKKIVDKIQELHDADDKDGDKKSMKSESRIRIAVGELVSIGVFAMTQIRDYKKRPVKLYNLTPIGSKLFKEKYGNVAIPSELDKLIAGFDEVEHGYAVKTIEEIFNANNSVTKVSAGKDIDVGNNIKYKTDIICEIDGKESHFVYEGGARKQVAFNTTYNKLCKVTDTINIVAGSSELVTIIISQIESWIKSRGGNKALATKTLRIITIDNIAGNLGDESKWFLKWSLGDGKPVINTK